MLLDAFMPVDFAPSLSVSEEFLLALVMVVTVLSPAKKNTTSSVLTPSMHSPFTFMVRFWGFPKLSMML